MTKSNSIKFSSQTNTIQALLNLFENKDLELSPGFQRDSVWSLSDRKKLIDSIVRNYPIPAIFLYKRYKDGRIIYDVIDGKQRLESILMFVGYLRGNKFSAYVQLTDEDESFLVDWNYIKKKKKNYLITDYKITTIEVDGDLSDIIDLFVRINSTGKALSKTEKLNAQYYTSKFLKESVRMARKYEPYFIANKIISKVLVSRMKHVELICELMISIYGNDVINKKAAVDNVMDKNNISEREIKQISKKTSEALNLVKKIFPRLKETRFNKISDFYILVFLFSKFKSEGFVLNDRKRNKIAWEILVRFSDGVDSVREKHKRMKKINEADQMFIDYLLTVQQSSDEISQRRKRFNTMNKLFESLFEKKDKQRSFTTEQRRLIWHSSSEKNCKVCNCKLTWEDFTVDHKKSHSRGGKSILENAQLMCRKHNSQKGNRM